MCCQFVDQNYCLSSSKVSMSCLVNTFLWTHVMFKCHWNVAMSHLFLTCLLSSLPSSLILNQFALVYLARVDDIFTYCLNDYKDACYSGSRQVIYICQH